MKLDRAPKLRTTDFRKYLQEVLLKRCRQNESYSLRAFARSLALEPSFLSKVLSGKRSVTVALIDKLSLPLGLSPEEHRSFCDGVKRSKQSRKTAAAVIQPEMQDYQTLTFDHFRMIADWYHYALLELVTVDDFQNDEAWIAQQLGVSPMEVKATIERLERLGMLERDAETGKLKNSSGNNTTVGNPFTVGAFRKLQKQVLKQALEALESTPLEERDQTSMTMAIDPALLPEAKKRLRDFRREFCAFLQAQGTPRKRVYQLSLSLFPVSGNKSKKEKTV